MLRITTFLLFLVLAVLSVLALPPPTSDSSDPYTPIYDPVKPSTPIPDPVIPPTLKQATRAEIVQRGNASPVRRQSPSALPFVIRPFRLRIPTDFPDPDYAGLYFIGDTLGRIPVARTPTAGQAAIYQISPTGAFQPASDLTIQAFVFAEAKDSNARLYTSAIGNSNGGAPLSCSVNANLILVCTDPNKTGRTVGVNYRFIQPTLAFSVDPTESLSLVVEYL